MNVRVFDIRDNITKLGPGVRFVIWTQGCPRRCKGCMSPNSQSLDGGYLIDVDFLVEQVKKSGRTELTISGGEPFMQAAALTEMIKKLRETIDLGVIVYTGYTIEEINSFADSICRDFLSQCDLVIDGEYIEALNDGKNLRGSSNQRAIPITDRYMDLLKDFGKKPTEVEIFCGEEKICMVGVPSREIFDKFKNIFN